MITTHYFHIHNYTISVLFLNLYCCKYDTLPIAIIIISIESLKLSFFYNFHKFGVVDSHISFNDDFSIFAEF